LFDFIVPSASSKNPKAFVTNAPSANVRKLVDAFPVETFVEFFSAAFQFEFHLFFVEKRGGQCNSLALGNPGIPLAAFTALTTA
jgi:hypothetical protein